MSSCDSALGVNSEIYIVVLSSYTRNDFFIYPKLWKYIHFRRIFFLDLEFSGDIFPSSFKMTFHFHFLICKLPIQIFAQCLLTFIVSVERFAVRFVTKMACIFVLINLKKSFYIRDRTYLSDICVPNVSFHFVFYFYFLSVVW